MLYAMDIDNSVEQIYEIIKSHGYENARDFNAALCNGKIDYKKFFDLFNLDEQLPQIVTDEDFVKKSGRIIYSGSSNLKKTVQHFQQGSFRIYSCESTYEMGLGFYFTPQYTTASEYMKTNEGGVMMAKIIKKAKVMDMEQLHNFKCEEFLCHNSKKRKFIYDALNVNVARTIYSSLAGADALKRTQSYWGTTYCITNRSILIQPQNPDVKIYQTNN